MAGGIPYFPPSLKAKTNEWNLSGNIVSSGQTGSGLNPVVRLDAGGLWVAKLSGIFLRNKGAAKLWRAVKAMADGGGRAMIVCDCDGMQPWPTVDGEILKSYGDIEHSDGALFSDGSGYSQPVIDVVSSGSAALRAVTMTLDIVQGAALEGGEAFSIDHVTWSPRRYEIITVTIDEDGLSVITFRPPLREAMATGTRLEFDEPRCVMAAASISALDYVHEKHPLARQNAVLVEAAAPPAD